MGITSIGKFLTIAHPILIMNTASTVWAVRLELHIHGSVYLADQKRRNNIKDIIKKASDPFRPLYLRPKMKNIIKNKHSIAAVIFLTTFIQGCFNCQYTKRQQWLDPKFRMEIKIESSIDEGMLVNESMLLKELGPPDHIISPREFKERLSVDAELSKIIIKRMVSKYLEATSNKNQSHKSYGFYQDYEFDKNCMLWLYDESMHFKKPVKPPIFTMCADIGFSCYCFYIEGNNVIGGTVFQFWKPLKQVRQ